MSNLVFTITPEAPSDVLMIEKLHERAFGPGRFARTASRMRNSSNVDQRLSFVARAGTLLVGSICQLPVTIGIYSGLLLGPLTVEPAFEGKGIGRALMETSIKKATELGYKLVVLVGDAPYYARVGFKQVPMGKLVLPGPVDPARLLYLELEQGILVQINNAIIDA